MSNHFTGLIPESLLAAIKRGECTLFLGAGVHAPPSSSADKAAYPYPDDHRPPLGDSFSCQLADQCISELDTRSRGDRPDPNLADAQRAEIECKQREELREKKREYLRKHREELKTTSWFYEMVPIGDGQDEQPHGRGELVGKIKAAVETGKQPSPLVRALAEIDFRVIITTNYDQLFEKALSPKKPVVRIYDPRGKEPTEDFPGDPTSSKEPWFFKMHGCISEPESIVITDEDYVRWVMRIGDREDFRPVPQKVRTYFKEKPTLFVGYSLLDYNLRLLFRTLRRNLGKLDLPPTFSLDPRPDLLVLKTYTRENVSFIEQDSWRFVPELYQNLFGRGMPK